LLFLFLLLLLLLLYFVLVVIASDISSAIYRLGPGAPIAVS
jgi:hypothetical protein